MPAGLQIINGAGSYQIDGDYANLMFIRKVAVSTVSFASGQGTSNNPSQASITLNGGELFAFACASPSAFVGRSGNTVYVNVAAHPGAIVTFYVFARGSGTSNFGLEVYDAAGSLTFSSSWELLNILGVTSGAGNFNYGSGRTYAVIPQSQYIRLVRTTTYQGTQPNIYVVYNRSLYYQAVSINSGSISVAEAPVHVAAWVFLESSGGGVIGWDIDVNNGGTTRYVVVDVSGL
ncbi:hypothetical protein [Stutzerimonas stutzeri]|uniref:hypothetical protein n=1 Tax=Stutzerimonas stutzeri TaxID=316 RepID=UPI0005EBE661|nr:hypothetical protein [Stutzerimonas stutzeri]